jgi:hypothetical protein
MKNVKTKVVIPLLCLCLILSSYYIFRINEAFDICLRGLLYCMPHYEGPYKGRVLDAETKQPLEGVVVLGVWYSESPTFAGVVGKYYDAKETVTDKEGEFEISGQGIKMLSNLSRMHVLIFKAGYEHIGTGPWESFKLDPMFKSKIAWEGEKVIVSLRKLTAEERTKQRSPSYPSNAPSEKMAQTLREINKDSE